MLNQKEVQTNWPEIKKRILRVWSKLTLQDVDSTDGNINLLRRLVQKKYGLAEDFNTKLEELCDSQFRGIYTDALSVSTFHIKI